MGKYIYQDYSMEDRITILKNQAIKVQVDTYNRSLSDKEIDAEKDRYSRDAIELERQQDEMKRHVDQIKAGIESIKTLMKERLDRIKTGQTEVRGALYGIANHNTGRISFYDQYGEMISSRELTPDEWQGRLFIGDAPSEGGNREEINEEEGKDDGIMDVEFEELSDEDSTGNIDIPQQEPEEDKPKKKKKPGRKPRKKKDENPDDENAPL